LPFLALDHISGGGAIHRKEIGGGADFYRWLIKSGFPPGYQVLCHNCNLAKSAYGSCRHTRKRMIIGRSITHINSSRTMGMSVGVPTTRARKCKLSVQTARQPGQVLRVEAQRCA
jgi:hypothetical protein